MTNEEALRYLRSIGWKADEEDGEIIMFPPGKTRPIVRTTNELPAYAEGVKRAIEGVKNAKN